MRNIDLPATQQTADFLTSREGRELILEIVMKLTFEKRVPVHPECQQRLERLESVLR